MAKARFLMPGGGQGPERLGYSHEPLRRLQPDTPETKDRIAACTDLRDEPESISGAWINANTELAARRDRERYMQVVQLARIARNNLSLEHRIQDCRRRAKEQRVDITSALFVISKQQARGNETAATIKVLSLEARLDGVKPST
jgi:hypothetical protein